MPSAKKYRRPKCSCGATLNQTTKLCPFGCEAFRKPSARVLSFERGRTPEPVGLPTFHEADAAWKASGVAASLATIPVILIRRRA